MKPDFDYCINKVGKFVARVENKGTEIVCYDSGGNRWFIRLPATLIDLIEKNYADNKDSLDEEGYDIEITKEGTGIETKYNFKVKTDKEKMK